jgi:hypothetical protein
MQLFSTDQQSRFEYHLNQLKQVNVMSYDRSQLVEKETVFPINTDIPFDQLNTDILFDYRIFPEHILSALPEWSIKNRAMQPGDTILQQACLPPLKRFSLKMLFGVRICAIIDEPGRKGFSYETLKGHVERGISTFTLERRNGKPVFVIRTFSQPGNRLMRLFGFLSVPYQAFCTKAAGKHVTGQLNGNKAEQRRKK